MKGKCKECGREFSDQPNEYPGKVHVHQGEATCESCLINMGALPDHDKEAHERLMMEQVFFI